MVITYLIRFFCWLHIILQENVYCTNTFWNSILGQNRFLGEEQEILHD